MPWKLIAGTRDKLIHFYEGVDLDEVWKMVTSDLSELIRLIEPLAQIGRDVQKQFTASGGNLGARWGMQW